jgi:hypothetical protein
MSRNLLLFFAMLSVAGSIPCLSQNEPPPPVVEGYVTRYASPSDFDVNGIHIVLAPNVTLSTEIDSDKFVLNNNAKPYLGEATKVFGKRDNKTHTVVATRVILRPALSETVSGFGIIHQVQPAGPQTADVIVHADGYTVLIPAKLTAARTAPLDADAPISSNLWISFHGKQTLNGTVIADKVTLAANTISNREGRFIEKSDYDPSVVDPESKQGKVDKFFRGVDVKMIPPYDDPIMQARVDRIGKSLIPEYQRKLPFEDLTKIIFQFQVVDQPKWHDAITMPSGVILVPYQVVERLQNDSQLATVLADNIITAMDQQSYRQLPAVRTMQAANSASLIGGLFVPGLSLATSGVSYGVGSRMRRLALEQSGRGSLCLLHDAGYDIDEAPHTWWLLAPNKPLKDPTNLAEAPLPDRAAYLYRMLGTTWNPQQPGPTATTSAPLP